MNYWASLDPKYRLILCDVWGVVHDGLSLYPGAEVEPFKTAIILHFVRGRRTV